MMDGMMPKKYDGRSRFFVWRRTIFKRRCAL
jgi:hypothetical protein